MSEPGWMYRSRAYWTQRLRNEMYDLIIIGGGITGAGIAREAALAGLRVALLEAFDFGSGTSSRSTKLVHGGLRYLAQGHVRLVREAGSERAILRRLVPHLVRPVPFLLPIYKGMQHGLFKMSTAVWLYDWLAGVMKEERRKVLSNHEIENQYPNMDANGLQGGVLYHEYVTDDARLTLATLQSAGEWGAVSINDCPVTGLIVENDKIAGISAIDRETGENLQVHGHVVVNAAGPWIENVLGLEQYQENRQAENNGNSFSRITQSRGIHLSFSAARLSLHHALAVQTPDGRLVFCISKGDITYVGTTDKRYSGDLHHPEVPGEEVDYLLGIVNDLMPDLKLTRADLIGVWSGVRPLVTEHGKDVQTKDTKDVSREDEIWVSPQGLITIAGGKLTAYRKMAERVLAKVRLYLEIPNLETGIRRGKVLSEWLPLFGAKGISFPDVDNWWTHMTANLIKRYGISPEDCDALLRRYGDQTENVLTIASSNDRILPEFPLLESEVMYMMQFEMARHVSDIIVRRTELGRFRGLQLRELIEAVAKRMQDSFNWSDELLQEEVSKCLRECHFELVQEKSICG